MDAFYYNTNGFAFHRVEDAVVVLADLGYQGIALTPDVHHLDPTGPRERFLEDLHAFRRLLESRGLGVVIETGARFVLDPRRKHRPSLLDAPDEADRRLAFLSSCVDMAAVLGAPVVSTWAGVRPADVPPDEAMTRLVTGLRRLCERASDAGVRVGFEPEPGMLVERADEWPRLRDRVGHPALGLTLDVGHCLATGEGEPADAIRAHGPDLLVIQLDDHRRGIHEHLAFGEGEIDVPDVAAAIADVGFGGPLEVELSGHSSTAPEAARRALAYLRSAFGTSKSSGPS